MGDRSEDGVESGLSQAIRLALSSDGGPAEKILACQAALRDHPAGEGEGALLALVLNTLGEELLHDRISRQDTAFRLKTLMRQLTGREPLRLTGEAAAMDVLLARALGAMSKRAARGIFDGAHYLARYPDIAAARVDPLAHFIAGGGAEGRYPADLAQVLPGAMRNLPRDLAALGQADPAYPETLSPALRDEAMAVLHRARPRVSVILPSYNRARLLPHAVLSALLQSWPAHEVLVVDDGSTDGSADLLEARFAAPIETGQLRVIRSQNRGVSAARNLGLAAASGDVIAYLDSDNRWEPDHLLYALSGLISGGADCAYTAVARHDLEGGWSDILFRPFDAQALREENFIDLNGFVHRRGLHDRLGGFDEALTRLVDWDLVLRYTAAAPPVAVPVITTIYALAERGIGNLSFTVGLEPNLARIRQKHGIG
ncbi:glycosyltransferase family 2 protein [Pseudogemmobacter sonorensis]|uniref:glycosyltransferase family 2 protein n=1 Tax=Pseudogemmobacter sonorensis TaxID=2989681 RepID=UPI0036A6F382